MSLADLIEMLEKATGPSLELEGMVWCAVAGYEFVMWDGAGCVYRDPAAPKWDAGIKHAAALRVRPYTASLDAAVDLCSRALPGWRGSIQFGNFGGPVNAYVCADETVDDVIASHPVPAIALCIAILKAKQAQETTE